MQNLITTQDELLQLSDKIAKTLYNRSAHELAVGWLRYEALRLLTPLKFAQLYQFNLNGENFDDMVTKLIIKSNEK